MKTDSPAGESSLRLILLSFIFSDKIKLIPLETVHFSTGTYFSANPSFRLVETSFLSTGNSIVLFQVFSASGN